LADTEPAIRMAVLEVPWVAAEITAVELVEVLFLLLLQVVTDQLATDLLKCQHLVLEALAAVTEASLAVPVRFTEVVAIPLEVAAEAGAIPSGAAAEVMADKKHLKPTL